MKLKEIMKDRKSIKVSDYFKLINPKYSMLQLTPDTSIRNYNSESIASVICNMYSIPRDRLSRNKFRFSYKLPYKASFIIDIQLKEVNFYIVVPEEYENLIKEKCSVTWPKATIDKIDSIPVAKDPLTYELRYKFEDGLSLKVDKKTNEPLNSLLNVTDIMEGDDKTTIYYNFIPTNQLSWRNSHRYIIDKIKKDIPVDKNKFSFWFIVGFLIDEIAKILITLIEEVGDFMGDGKNVTSKAKSEISITGMNKFERLSNATLRKGEKNIIDTQILVLSESRNEIRKKNNAIAICESFKNINEDNSLIYKKIKPVKSYFDYKVNKAAVNKLSTSEVASNCLLIPGRTILDHHKNINRIDALENPVPEELDHGYIDLGESICKGKKQHGYMRDEKHLGNLGLVVMGPQGCGKTTFLANYVYNANSRKEGVVVLDFIKNCELSSTIESIVPSEDLLILDLSKPEDLQGIGYNEIKFTDNMTDFEILEVANMQAQQTMSLVDAINAEGAELSSRMRRYLSAAANVVYINEFKDKETKEVHKEITGTKASKIEYILDRINLLKEDIKLKYMFNKSLDDNIDFVEELEKGKVILINMPDSKFPLKYVKNVIVTYFMTKIWLSAQLRGAMHENLLRSHIIIDEIFQAPTSEKILKDILPQCRKFGTKFVLSCHYLSQINTIEEALKASGASYMLLQGTDKKNYNELKEELQPYQLEDLLNLKQHQSLNLIKYEKGYAKFVTRLPKPI